MQDFLTPIQQEKEETGQNYPTLAAFKRKIAYHCEHSLGIFNENVLFCCLYGNSSPNLDIFIHNFCLQFTFGNK